MSKEWLPPGWCLRVQMKDGVKIQYYANLSTGQKFSSKDALLRYVTGYNQSSESQPSVQLATRNSTKKYASSENPVKSSSRNVHIPTERPVKNSSRNVHIPSQSQVRSSSRKKHISSEDPVKSSSSNVHIPSPSQVKSSSQNKHTPTEVKRNSRSKDIPVRLNECAVNESSQTKHIPTTVRRSSRIKHIPRKDKENEASDIPGWLPDGWTVEIKVRQKGLKSGEKYKCYFDPSSKSRFYSKPEVFRYLETVKGKNCTSKKKEGTATSHLASQSNGDPLVESKPTSKMEVSQIPKLVNPRVSPRTPKAKKVKVQRFIDEELPLGWISEYKIRKNGKKDPYHTDPVTGYVFCSKRDVFRYLSTGEISRRTIKAKERSIDDAKLENDENSPLSSAGQKSKHSSTRRRLFVGNEDDSSIVLPETDGSRKKGHMNVTTQTSGPATAQSKGTKNKLNQMVCADMNGSAPPGANGLKKRGRTRKFPESNASSTTVADTQEKAVAGPAENNGGSKRKRAKKVDAEKKLDAAPAAGILQKESPEGLKRRGQKRRFPEIKASTTTVAGTQVEEHLPDEAVPQCAENKDGSMSSASTPASNILQEKKPIENGTKEGQNHKAYILPCRSSKRLAGIAPETVPSFEAGKQAPGVAGKGAVQDVPTPVSGPSLNASVDKAFLQLDTEQETSHSEHANEGMVSPLSKTTSYKTVIAEQNGYMETEEKAKKAEEKPESEQPSTMSLAEQDFGQELLPIGSASTTQGDGGIPSCDTL
ncbi:Methyl-CpG DNA binding [Dillenia turbinata]|uniref:Methyl-CpG DNA binding n=1 Tax=Dillenia turbinata TaxID=194707 RepID=A0AAN8W7S6_9MAGN